MAYVGRKGGKEFVVLDGAAPGAAYDSVANLDFTPDGRHVVYTARRAGKSVVVVDGVESRVYDAFLPAREHEREGTLNVEGNTSLSILARRGPELLRVEIEIVRSIGVRHGASLWAWLIQVKIMTQRVSASVKSGNCNGSGRE